MQLLTIKQACHRLACGRTKLWALIRDGEIKAVSLSGVGGKSKRIPESEIERFIRSQLDEVA